MNRRMTQQDVLNKVWKHLRKQDEQCITKDGECKYRSKNDRMCAVGALIPDELYSKKFEGNTIKALFEDWETFGKTVQHKVDAFKDMFHKKVTVDFLQELQSIHDYHLPKQWEEELTSFCKQWDLKPLKKRSKK